jgi:hypothetical protein
VNEAKPTLREKKLSEHVETTKPGLIYNREEISMGRSGIHATIADQNPNERPPIRLNIYTDQGPDTELDVLYVSRGPFKSCRAPTILRHTVCGV